MKAEFYDAEYFEDGINSGKSLYVNYRWLEQQTLELASELAKHLGIPPTVKILDYGCAKGYLVKSFHINGLRAYGVDISDYAIANSPVDIRNYLKRIDSANDIPAEWGIFDYIIAKDTLEHIDSHLVGDVLSTLAERGRKLFVIVPIGDGVKFVDPGQELDISHKIKEPICWWVEIINLHGWKVIEHSNHMPNIKPNYRNKPGTHAFITAVANGG